MVKIFKALAHGRRMTILGLLKDKCRTVSELCRLLNMNRASVYKHLIKLEDAGLVKRIGYRDGDILYDLTSAKVYRLLENGVELTEKRVFENVNGQKIVDVRGELCPVPLIKTEKIWNKLRSGETVEIWTDYELSKERILTKYKNFVISCEEINGFWRIVLRK